MAYGRATSRAGKASRIELFPFQARRGSRVWTVPIGAGVSNHYDLAPMLESISDAYVAAGWHVYLDDGAGEYLCERSVDYMLQDMPKGGYPLDPAEFHAGATPLCAKC